MESAVAPQKKPLLNSWLLLFIFAMILANIGGNMYGPLMPLYLQKLNASVAQVGLFFTLSRVIPLLLQIVGGYISDSLGRLRAIAIGSVVGIFTYVALIAAPSWEWALVATIFGAITGSLIGPSFDAFVAEHSDEANRGRIFAITQTIFAIVGVVGPVLGGWLVDTHDFRFMLFIAAAFYVAATILRVGMAREAAKGTESKPKPLSFAGLRENLSAMFALMTMGGVVTWILLTDGVRDISFSLSFDFLPIFMRDFAHLSTTQIGLTNSIFGVFMMLFMYPAGVLSDKMGERVGISLGFLLVSVALSLIIFLPNPNMLTSSIGWAVAGAGVGLMTPAYQSLISKAVPKHLRGTAFGLFNSSIGLVSLPAPLLGSQLWENISPRFPFMITVLVCFLSIIPVWFKFKLDRPADEEKPQA
jgi:MFS family permease